VTVVPVIYRNEYSIVLTFKLLITYTVSIINVRETPKGQSIMENLETLATLITRHRTKTNKSKQK